MAGQPVSREIAHSPKERHTRFRVDKSDRGRPSCCGIQILSHSLEYIDVGELIMAVRNVVPKSEPAPHFVLDVTRPQGDDAHTSTSSLAPSPERSRVKTDPLKKSSHVFGTGSVEYPYLLPCPSRNNGVRLRRDRGRGTRDACIDRSACHVLYSCLPCSNRHNDNCSVNRHFLSPSTLGSPAVTAVDSHKIVAMGHGAFEA